MRDLGFFLAMARSYAPTPMPVHLHPTAALAPRALLPGDPGRALLLAQLLTSEPKMFNHNRGLWGYTGIGGRRRAADDPEHRHGRPERGDRARGALRPRPAARDPRRDVRRARRRPRARRPRRRRRGAGVRRHEPRARRRRAGRGRRRPRRGAAAPRPARGARAGAVATSDLFYDRDPARARAWAARGRARGRDGGGRAAARRRAARRRRRLPAGGHRHVRRDGRAPAHRRRRPRRRGRAARPSPPRRSPLRGRR